MSEVARVLSILPLPNGNDGRIVGATNAERRTASAMDDKQRAALGAALRTARERQGLSYGQLGELVGVNKSQVMRWETGERPPSPQNLVDLAEQLELRAADLFELAGIPI